MTSSVSGSVSLPVYAVREAGLVTITLNRADHRNALTRGMVTSLLAELTKAAADPDVRLVVLRAAGRDFCTGLDLDEFYADAEAPPDVHRAEARELAEVLTLLQRERVTIFAAVPTMYQMLTTAPSWETADLSALRFCTSGGAPLPVPLVEKYTQEKNVRFKQGFGMTEFGPGIFALAPEDAIRKAGSIGRPNFFVAAQIVDEGSRLLGPHEPGELVLKGPSYCSGYFNNPEATEAAVDERGFFHTGDVAYYDEEGYFYIVDRKKDMFISGGENVYPSEIERALYRHPAVHMCAVIGVPDDRWGEVGKACVVLKPGGSTSEEELLQFLTEHLAKYKVPRSVAFMDSLPISAAGKILKR